jgi:uncharacterized protein (DUF111 family)
VRTLHFDCFSGISCDMTLAALLDAGADAAAIRDGLDSLGLPIRFSAERIRKTCFSFLWERCHTKPIPENAEIAVV